MTEIHITDTAGFRTRLRRSLIILSALAAIWTVGVAWSGGFVTAIGPFSISSRSPRNPALIAAAIAGAAWMLGAAGRRRQTLAADVLALAGSSSRWLRCFRFGAAAAGLNLLLIIVAAAILLHGVSWTAAAIVIGGSLHVPPIQSFLALGTSALFLLAANRLPRRGRVAAGGALLALFYTATVAFPLESQFAGTGFMGDGADYAEHREKFEGNIPFTAGDPEIHFKAHLADAVLGTVDVLLGRTDTSPGTAYRLLSYLGGLLCVGELLLVLALSRWSRRACRHVGLALATPIVLCYFAFYETGYMAASVGVFPLLMRSLRGRLRRPVGANEGAGILQGLHAAFHGFGLLGMAGGALMTLKARRDPVAQAVRFAVFALAAYLVWVVLYIVVFKITVEADTYSANVALRHLTGSFYFDRRLVHPLLSWNAVAEIGAASVAVGVPVLALAAWYARAPLERHAALLYALPGLLFLIVWWPSAGVSRDMDLLLSAFAGINGAVWILSRSGRTSLQTWFALAAVHVGFWSVVADRTLDRIWLP